MAGAEPPYMEIAQLIAVALVWLAVTAVRPGLRIVLSRASCPVMPRQASGRASTRARPTITAEKTALIRARTRGTRVATAIAITTTSVPMLPHTWTQGERTDPR